MSESIITRSIARDMVVAYRNAPDGGINPNTGQQQSLTQFVHITFAQFFELLGLNGIASGTDTVNTILQTKSNFGIKIYFAQHANAADCPEGDTGFIGRNTIVIANTVFKNGIWYDIPDRNNEIDEIQEYVTATSGDVLDRGLQCPPKCVNFSNNL